MLKWAGTVYLHSDTLILQQVSGYLLSVRLLYSNENNFCHAYFIKCIYAASIIWMDHSNLDIFLKVVQFRVRISVGLKKLPEVRKINAQILIWFVQNAQWSCWYLIHAVMYRGHYRALCSQRTSTPSQSTKTLESILRPSQPLWLLFKKGVISAPALPFDQRGKNMLIII